MSLTTIQQLRLYAQDIPAIVDATYYGDGLASSFALPHRNLVSGSAFVQPGGTAWSATGATFNSSGEVIFSAVVSANSAFRVRYVHSMFSDDEVQQFIDDGGGLAGAKMAVVEALMFDGVRRADWRAPDGSEWDDTAALAHLRQMHDILKRELGEAAAGSGGSVTSWAEEQENW